jgi:hypothetical protein
MRWPSLEMRRNWIVDHPARMGFVWSALTVLLVALFDLARHGTIDKAWTATFFVVFAIAGPAWGYLTRWAILQRRGEFSLSDEHGDER